MTNDICSDQCRPYHSLQRYRSDVRAGRSALQGEKREHGTNNRACVELILAKVSSGDIVKISKRPIRRGFIQPLGNNRDELVLRTLRGDGSAEELPVGLSSVIDSNIMERNAILLEDGRVETALDVINLLLDELCAQLTIRVEVVKQAPSGLIVVLELLVFRGAVVAHGPAVPLLNVLVSDGCIVNSVFGVASAVGDLCHCFNTYHA